jgi:hypothetical protein
MPNNAEDEALRRKNAVFAAHPTPGVGQPGSTPATDAANLSIAESMRRADLGSRFGFGSPQHLLGVDAPSEVLRAQRDPSELIDSAIQARRELLSQGVDPDAPARFITPKRRAELLHEELALTQIQHEEALTRSVGKAQAYKMTKDIEVSNDLDGLIRDLRGVKSKIGTPEHATEITDIGLNHIAAIQGTKLGSDLFKTHTAVHDRAAETAQAIADYRAATGLEPGSVETTATGGVNIRGKPKSAAKSKTVETKASDILEHGLLNKYGMTPDQFANPVSAKAGRIEGGKFTNQYTGAEKGDTMQIDTGQGKVNMPREDYNYFKRLHEVTAAGTETAKPTPSKAQEAPTQFDTEEAARSAGHKAGDIVILKNPATGKYQRARLEASEAAPAASASETEKVIVQKGGKQFRLPKSQLKDAQTQGYELVQ